MSCPLALFVRLFVRRILERVDKSLQDLHYNREKLEPCVCFSCESCSELHPVSHWGTKLHRILLRQAQPNQPPAIASKVLVQ